MSERQCPDPMCGGVCRQSKTCGVFVCENCRNHLGLVRCFCGWSHSGDDGYRELIEMGEVIEDA